MDAAKRQRYEKIAEGLTKLSGGKDNIQGMSLGDLKTVANQKMNPFQRIIKALSDVFVDIMPGILAAPLLTGLSGVLGNLDFVHNNAALFGVNLLSRYPLIGGCIGGALSGMVVYLTNLAALGFGTTVLPGIALADPAGNGYVSYIIAHAVAIAGGFLLTLVFSGFMEKKEAANQAAAPAAPAFPPAETPEPEAFYGYAQGTILPLEEVKDETFASKVLGDGVAVEPSVGKVFAPADAVVTNLADTKHAIGLQTRGGNEVLIHIGIDTVQLPENSSSPM